MSLIALQNLTKKYPRGVTALDGLTLDLEPGIIGLVGANGAGKSTLIKILLGLLPPTSGNASVMDFDVRTKGTTIRQFVGYMPEYDCLPPDTSATDFVSHMARMSGLPSASARERTAEVLRHVGLYEERYRAMGGYSTGMKQRVKLAQALVHGPRLLLLDEPTNGLDPAGMVDMRKLIVDLARGGQTVLLSSHLLDEVQEICDRVGVINKGVLLMESTVSELRGGASLAVRGQPVDRALAVAMGLAGDDGVHMDGDRMLVDLGPDQAPDLVRELVAGGVAVHEVTTVERTLEEVFFEMTRTEKGNELEATR